MTGREGRLGGVDLARGLAVFGMFAAHVGPDPNDGGLIAPLMQLTHGRSSVLFATLAGLSLALITGRQQPDATWRHGVRITIRAIVLIALGTFLTLMKTPVAVILAYYGVYFLLALPFLRLRAPALFSVAAVIGLIGPVFSMLARGTWWTWGDPLEDFSGEGALQFLLTGYYPAAAWMAYVLTGMGLGRLDLNAARTRLRLAIVGPVMIVLGYGGGSVARAVAGESGRPRRDQTSWLLQSSPHSDTSFEIVGALGVAITVLACALPLARRLPRLTRPITSVGAMPLSIYTGHLLVIALIMELDIDIPPGWELVSHIVGAMVFASVWMTFFRRGPLEYGLAGLTKWIALRPSQRPVTRGFQPE
ncbi:putative membrane protein YeiB [Kibdelosporangium banguiense]|uniref:Membrane protein YeiB n=1 Tax=Kibdelosporangium banguiense TaxID=1365924 RepID=A0ABS4TJ02_9PSEU|nr:heparan-alpha-glucosaminide N-acetyltransferase domain-containing protein [Kibdelosporangium banguiense]MBP2324388.1 putative membrane protein YeiB [Kibdelosporangium banguiense]